MDCLYLKPEARGKGYGEKFIELIRDEAKSSGLDNVQWQTPLDNLNAIEFYKKIGTTSKAKVRFYLKAS